MRGQHPLWRGFFLAAALTAIRFFLGETDSLSVFKGERPALFLYAALTLGGLLAALPSLLRSAARARSAGGFPAKAGHARPSVRRLMLCFACGAAMALGLGIAGGSVLSALLSSSVGAYAFCAAALAAGCAVVRLSERRAKA